MIGHDLRKFTQINAMCTLKGTGQGMFEFIRFWTHWDKGKRGKVEKSKYFRRKTKVEKRIFFWALENIPDELSVTALSLNQYPHQECRINNHVDGQIYVVIELYYTSKTNRQVTVRFC